MKRFRSTLIFLFLLLALAIALYSRLPGFLALQRPVGPGDVLLEAWIPSREAEMAVDRYLADPSVTFFTVGRSFPEVSQSPEPWAEMDVPHPAGRMSGTWLFANSSLELKLTEVVRMQSPDTMKVTLEVEGHEAGGLFAHFNLVWGGHVVGGDFSRGTPVQFSYSFINSKSVPASLFIRFNNDLKLAGSDRNLHVLSVTVNGVPLAMDPAHARITRETNRLTTGFASQALETADYLEKLGVPSSRLVAVAFDPRGPNLTLAAARSFRLRYADRPPPAAFNVVSSGIHCRRTWIAYKKLFRGKSAVGVLNFHPEGYTRNNEFDDRPFWMLLADEGLSYLITWIRLTLWPSS